MKDFFASLPIFLIVSYIIQCVLDFTWTLAWGIYFTIRYFNQYGLDLSYIDKVKKDGLGVTIPPYNTKFLLLVCVAIGIPATYIILHLQFVP